MLLPKNNEHMAHSYSHIYKVPTTGIDSFQFMDRGRPDMALFIFTKKIIKKRIIEIFFGDMKEILLIYDAIDATIKVINKILK